MSTERTIYCDGPDCPHHVRTATPPPYLPVGVIETRDRHDGTDEVHHFCCWDCAMKFAAKQPVPEVIPWTPDDGDPLADYGRE